jgi:AcrR family transcriptional regulator
MPPVKNQSASSRPLPDAAPQTVQKRAPARPDRRIQRTRRALEQALLELIAEKGYDAVTIQDLIDRADVGRSTFYMHYLDKEQLLLSRVDELRAFLSERQRQEAAGSMEPAERVLGFSRGMLEHAADHHKLYTAMVGKRGGAVIHRVISGVVADLVRAELTAARGRVRGREVPTEAIVEYTVAAFMALLGWWMDNDMPCSAAEMDSLVRSLIGPGVAAGLEQSTSAGRR